MMTADPTDHTERARQMSRDYEYEQYQRGYYWGNMERHGQFSVSRFDGEMYMAAVVEGYQDGFYRHDRKFPEQIRRSAEGPTS